MRCRFVLLALAFAAPHLFAQRHSGGSSPPTASQPIVAASSGMGPIQFIAVDFGVPAPQSLTRQLHAGDERTRAAALSAVGAPDQYMQHGRTAMPRSINLEFAPLGVNDDLDAVLTIELDQHIVTAILVPDSSGDWRRVATVLFATSLDGGRATPSTFVRTVPSLLQVARYRVVFRADSIDGKGDSVQNEAHLRVSDNRAIVTMSFTSAARECGQANAPSSRRSASDGGCNLTRRWFQPDPDDPFHRFTLVTATGRLTAQEAAEFLGRSPLYEAAHLRSFSCQPFAFSSTALRFEPTANSSPCPLK